jgi:hypothetical protein
MQPAQLIAHSGTRKLSRAGLANIPTPEGSPTHHPLPQHEIVEALVETLSYRQISVVRDECAVSKDGIKLFGVLDLEATFDRCRLHADSPIMPTPGNGLPHSACIGTGSSGSSHELHSA